MANSYLNRTLGTPTNSKKFTFSAWVKKSSNKSGGHYLLDTIGQSAGSENPIAFDGDQKFRVGEYTGSNVYNTRTTAQFRDLSGWYHCVVQGDSTQNTASDRIKIYVNNTLQAVDNSYPSQDYDFKFNISGNVIYVGRGISNSGRNMDGYMAHVAFVDGSVVAPTVFGETDSTSGIWKFKSPSGVTWGTNGFHLKFENSGALGTDSSGQSNTFTVNGDLKQALDTPSNVHATLNPLHRGNELGNATFSKGNNKHEGTSSGGNYPYTFSTLAASKGKWYAEFKASLADTTMIGIASGIADSFLGGTTSAKGYGLYGNNGNLFTNGSGSSYGSALSNNDILGVAMDLDNNKLYFHKNGTYHNSGDPTSGATGTGAVSITAPADNGTGVYHFACGKAGSATTSIQANFGNGYFGTAAITSAGSNGNGSLFEYDVPSGYYALNTKNINTYG